jgi:hypothetical protein
VPQGVGAAGDENLTFAEVWRMWQQAERERDEARAERDAMRAVMEAAIDLMTLHDHPNEAYRNEQKAAKWDALRKALRGVTR